MNNPKGFKKYPTNTLDASFYDHQKSSTSEDPRSALKVKKAWEIAYSPAKNIPIQALMLWMSGNGVQIFSISITLMLFYNPIKAIFGTSETFKPFRSTSGKNDALFLPQLVYILLQFLHMAMGVWKCSSMGLIPSTESDWLSFQPAREYMERSEILSLY